MMHPLSAALFALTLSSALMSAQSAAVGDLHLEPYSFRTYDGNTHPAELGHLEVLQDRGIPAKGLIQVGFVRLRSTAQKPGSPIVFLPGGPGIPGTVLGAVPVYYELLEKLQAEADVILFDQRGIGTSLPNTACPDGTVPPVDVFAKEMNFRRALVNRAVECGSYWRAKGVSLESFNTAESADDLDDLRRALGADKISILAHSYGTALALEFVRHREEHVDRLVLAGVEGPGESLQMPLVFDLALRRISDFAASDSQAKGAFPNTYHEFELVTHELDREPLAVRIRDARTKQDIDIKVGPVVAQFVVKEMLPNGRRVGQLPALVYSLARRDSSLIKPAVEDLYNGLASGFTAMQFSVACSDGWSLGRRQDALDQAPHSVFGDIPFVHLDPELCDRIGVKARAPASRLPLWSPAHALLINGSLDGNSPPFQAEEVLWGFPNAEYVSVKNGFHETLPSQAVQALVVEFFGGRDVSMTEIQFPPPSFAEPARGGAADPENRKKPAGSKEAFHQSRTETRGYSLRSLHQGTRRRPGLQAGMPQREL